MVSLRRLSPGGTLTAWLLAGTVVAFHARSTFGQQEIPTVRHSAPTVRSPGRTTTVDLDFTLPRGFQLARNPRLRVIDAKGQLVEFVPTYINARSLTGKGHRGLRTRAYLPGTYQVRAEIDYQDVRGGKGTVVSSWASLIVPER